MGVLRNSHDAEDVVQETFLRVHRKGFQSVGDLRAWLATIAFRIAIDRKRNVWPALEGLIAVLAKFDEPEKKVPKDTV